MVSSYLQGGSIVSSYLQGGSIVSSYLQRGNSEKLCARGVW